MTSVHQHATSPTVVDMGEEFDLVLAARNLSASTRRIYGAG